MTALLPARRAAVALADPARHRRLVAGLALAAGLAALGLVYAPEIAAAVRIWIVSTAFNHCLLVLPLAAYLLYLRKDLVGAATPQPAPLLAAVALPIALCWLVAERAGIMEARQFLAMGAAQLLVMMVLGPRTWRLFAAPLLYLFFLVPSGEFLVPWLQDVTTRLVGFGLDLLAVPHFTNGIVIEIPEGRFLIAEACAGLRFLIASLAFGTFFACLVYTSKLRRLVFIALSFVVPVVANGIRALGIVYLGHVLGSPQAAAVDHVLYGWLFFALVSAALTAIGLPFRQVAAPGHPTPATSTPASPAVAAAAAVVALVAIAAAPRFLADRLDAPDAQGVAKAAIALPLPAGCTPLEAGAGVLNPTAAPDGASLMRMYRCGADGLVLRLVAFPARAGAAPVFAVLRGASIVPGWDEVDDAPLALGGHNAIWRVADLTRQDRFASVGTSLWIDGRASGGGIVGRFRQALAGLQRHPRPTVLAILTTPPAEGRLHGRAVLEHFLARTNGLAEFSASSPPSSSRGETR